MIDDDLAAIEAITEAAGEVPDIYARRLLAEVQRLRGFRIAVEELTRAYYGHDERGLKPEMEAALRMLDGA